MPDSTVKISQPFGKLIIKSFDENNESSFSDTISSDHNFNDDYKLSSFISPSSTSYYSKSLPRSLSSGNGFIQRNNNYDLTANRSSLDIQTTHNTNMNRLLHSSSPSPNQTSSSLSSPTPPVTIDDINSDTKKDTDSKFTNSTLSKITTYARPPQPPPSIPNKLIINTPNNRNSLPNSYEEVRRINNIVNGHNNENSDQESVKLKPFIPGKVLIQQDTQVPINNENSNNSGERRAISQIKITPNPSYSSLPKSDLLNEISNNNNNNNISNKNNNVNSSKSNRFKNFKLIENTNHINQIDNNNNDRPEPQSNQQQQQQVQQQHQQRNKKSFKQLILNMGSKMVNI